MNELDRRWCVPPIVVPCCAEACLAASHARSEDLDGFIGAQLCGLGDCGTFPPLPRSEPNPPLKTPPFGTPFLISNPVSSWAPSAVWLVGRDPGAWRSVPAAARASARLFSRLWMRSCVG